MPILLQNIDQIFTEERTCNHFLDKKVDQALLEEIYNVMKFGPTSANSSPLRIIFVQSEGEKKKLVDSVMDGNKAKVQEAPVTAILSYDIKFYEKMDKLFPHNIAMKDMFGKEPLASDTAQRNSTLQAAYFIIASRSRGLSCGPMSGFDANAINNNFLADKEYKVNFICTLGYRKEKEKYPRLPRLDFDEACEII